MLGWAGSRLAVEESGQAWGATKDRAGMRKESDVVLDAGGPGWIEALALAPALGRNLAVYVLGQRSALLLLFFLFLFLLSESLR